MVDERQRLIQELQTYKMSTLQSMAKAAGVAIGGNKKVNVVAALAEALPKPERVQKALLELRTRERAVLDHLIASGGTSSAEPLKATLLRKGLIAPTPAMTKSYYALHYVGDPHKHNRREKQCFEDMIAFLTLQGLVLSRNSMDSSSQLLDFSGGSTVFIPPQILSQLPHVNLNDERTLPQVQRIVASSARLLQRDLYLYWSFARRQPLPLNQNGSVRKNVLKTLNDTLLAKGNLSSGHDESDEPRLLFLRKLATALDLLVYDDSTLRAQEEPTLIKQPPTERVQCSFLVWRDGQWWNELEHIPGVGDFSGGQMSVPKGIIDARRTILTHLTALEGDNWVGLDELIDRVRTRDYGFLLPRNRTKAHGYYHYGSYNAAYNTVYYGSNNPYGWTFAGITDDATGWETVEAGFIRNLIEHPLVWLGLVDLGLSEDDRLLAYRLTSLGRWLIGRGPQPEIQSEGGRVVVQPTFTILAIDPIPDATLATLDQFAERKGAERAIEYVLDRRSVYRGQQNGWTPDKIRQWLEETSRAPLPQNVSRSLTEWAALQDQIIIRRGVDVLQTGDVDLLAGLLRIPAIAGSLQQIVGPSVAILAPGQAATLQQTLQAQGTLSIFTSDQNKARRPSVSVDDEGHLTFSMPVPSIYLYGLLAPFAEANENGHWAVTQTTVRRALETGWTTMKILDQLRSIHVGPLPALFERQLRAWTKYYGDAKVQTPALLQLRDAQVLNELRADSELAALLKPMPPIDPASTALVAPEDLTRLRALLAERGIDLL